MTQNRDLRATVGFKTDLSSVKAAAAAFNTVGSAVAGMSAETRRLTPQLAALAAQEQAAAAATQKLAQTQVLAASSAAQNTSALRNQRAPVQDLTNLYRGLEEQAKRAGQAQDVAASSGRALPGRDIGGSGISSGFGTLRSLSGAVGLVAGNSQAGSTIAAFAGLVSVLGPAGIAVAGFAVALRAVTDAQEQATQSAKEYVAGVQEVAALTSAEAKQRIAQLQAEKDALVAAQDRLKLFQAQFEEFGKQSAAVVTNPDIALQEAFQAQIAATFQQLSDETNGLVYNQATLSAALAESNTSVDALSGKMGFLQLALDNGTTAANSAAEAARKLAEAQVAAAQTTLEIDRLTAAQRSQEVARNQRDIEILMRLQNAAETSTDAAELLSVQIGELTVRNRELNSVLTSTADLQAREKTFRDNAAKALQEYNDQLKIEAEALSRAEDIRQRINELTTDYEEKRRTALTDAEEKRSEITAEGAELRQEIDRDDAERRADILKQFNRSYGDAVANRDALAAVKAKEQRDDELEKQDKANRKALDQLDKQMEKQLQAVNKGLEKQQRSIDDAYNRQLRGLQQDLAEQNAIAENARQQQIVFQRNYNQLVEQAEIMHRAAQFKTIYDYGEMTGVYLSNLWRKIAEGAQNLYNNGGGVVGGPDSGVYPGASVGGNNLGSGGYPPLSDLSGNILSRSVNRPNLGSFASSGISPMRMPAQYARISGGGAPVINISLSPHSFTPAEVDKLWSPIRRMILDAI